MIKLTNIINLIIRLTLKMSLSNIFFVPIFIVIAPEMTLIVYNFNLLQHLCVKHTHNMWANNIIARF